MLQVASSVSNPLTFGRLAEAAFDHFSRIPMASNSKMGNGGRRFHQVRPSAAAEYGAARVDVAQYYVRSSDAACLYGVAALHALTHCISRQQNQSKAVSQARLHHGMKAPIVVWPVL